MRWLLLGLLLNALLVTSNCYAETEQDGWREVRDLAYGEVLYQFFQERYFSAITHLLTAREKGEMQPHGKEPELLLGGLYLSYGLFDQASHLFKQLLAANAEPRVRDQAWFYLARIYYQRGQYDQAEQSYAAIEKALPGKLLPAKQQLGGLIALARKQNQLAAERLVPQKDTGDWSDYSLFNRGIALVRLGQLPLGSELLAQVGEQDATTEELKALHDRANLALGYLLLEQGQPQPAAAYLQRVRLNSQHANQALLGAGWAAFKQEQPNQALIPWMELAQRTPDDPAVQQGLLLVPYTLLQLDAEGQALDRYRRAIDAYKRESHSLHQALKEIKNGAIIQALPAADSEAESGWFRRLRLDTGTTDNPYLVKLLSEHHFREALKDYLDLRFLDRNLLHWSETIDTYDHMLAARRSAYAKHLPEAKQALTPPRLENLQQQRAQLQITLASLTDGNHSALATTAEKRQLEQLRSLQQRLAQLAPHSDLAEQTERVRLLQGLLTWQLSTDYKPRLWEVRKGLDQVDQAITRVADQRNGLESAVQQAPIHFTGFAERIDRLRTRVLQLRPAIAKALDKQQQQVETLALALLEQRVRQLDGYMARARFAIAQIQDQTTAQRELAP